MIKNLLRIEYRPYGVAALCAIVSFLVYAITAAPVITLTDSGELALASFNEGVAHPPGFPFYMMVMRFLSFILRQDSAHFLNLASGFFSTVSVFCIVLIIYKILLILEDTDTPHPILNNVISAAIGLGLAFSFPLWEFGTITEVYSLSYACVFAAAVFLCDYILYERKRFIVLSAIAFSCSLGVHHVSSLFLVPFLTSLLFKIDRKKRKKGTASLRVNVPRTLRNTILYGSVTAVIVLIVYGYLFLSGKQDPYFNWGGITDFKTLYRHVSGWQYQSALFAFSPGFIQYEVARLLLLLIKTWLPTGFVFFILGITQIYRKQKRLFIGLAGTLFLNALYGFISEVAEDKEAYYCYLLVFGMVFTAYGFKTAWLSINDSREWLKYLILPALIAQLILPFAFNFNSCNHYGDRRAETFVHDITSTVGDTALILTQEWQFYSPFLYMHHHERFKPGVKAINIYLLKRSWYVRYLAKEMPDVMRYIDGYAQEYLKALAPFENSETYNGDFIQEKYVRLINAIIAYHHMNGIPVYTTVYLDQGLLYQYQIYIWGMLLRINPINSESVDFRPPWNYSISPDVIKHGHDLPGKKIYWCYSTMLRLHLGVYQAQGNTKMVTKLRSENQELLQYPQQYPLR